MKTEIEQIKEQLNSLTEQINNLSKPKFEVGKWYGFTRVLDSMVYNTNNENGYGFWGNEWQRNLGVGKKYVNRGEECDWFEYTQSEVLERLTQEAIKRGYKEGVSVISMLTGGKVKLNNETILRNFVDENKFYCMGAYIMKDGIWAEIVEDKNEAIEFAEFLKKCVIPIESINLKTAYKHFKNK